LSFTSPEADKWAERINRYARPDTVERVYADISLGARKYWTGDKRTGLLLLNQAVDLARRIGDPQALWLASSIFLWHTTVPQYTEQRVRLCEELWAGSHAGLNTNTAMVLWWIIDTSLIMGRLKQAEEVGGELRNLAKHTGQIVFETLSTSADAHMAVIDGRFEVAMELAESIRTHVGETNISSFGYAAASPGIKAQLYLGASLEAIGHKVPLGPAEMIPVPCLVHALLGRKKEATEIIEKNVVNRPGIGTLEDVTSAWLDILYLEASVLIGHRQATELLIKRFTGTNMITTGVFYTTCIPRHLGGAASLLGRYDEARKYYQEAIKVCTEMPFRPELALTRLQLAELLLEHYPDEKKEALEHLDFAIKEFREMKMQPSLERALSHKDILKA
jgi:tetratricopeptide (TPR) repeat protein